MRRIAVLFSHFGPYHFARVNAARKSADMLAVEAFESSETYDWTRMTPPAGLNHVGLALDPAPGQFDWSIMQQRLDKHVAPFQPDVIAVPGWSAPIALGALAWAGLRRIPAIIMSDSNWIDQPRRPLAEVAKRLVLRRASATLCAGAMAQDYLLRLGVTREQVFTGFDVIDNAHFAAGAAAARADPQMPTFLPGLNARWRGRFFLASARFIPRKNLAGLLRAYRLFRDHSKQPQEERWPLVVLGDGADRAELEALRSSLQLDAHVHMPGFIQYDALPAAFGLAGAFIHASTSEQWGLVVNEAMACDLPVAVSNRCGSAADLVRHGQNGVLFDPDEDSAMAQALEDISAPRTQSTMALASREIIANWGLDRFARGLTDAAEMAIKRGAPPISWPHRALLRMIASRNRHHEG